MDSKLTSDQRQQWRNTLAFPSHCESGTYEFDDKDAPILEFIPLASNKVIVMNICERYAYQDRVNIFIYDKQKKTNTKLTLPIVELDEGSVSHFDSNGNELASPTGTFKMKPSDLIQLRYITTTNDETLVITRHYSGAGNCGTRSKYRLTGNGQAKLVEFRAMISCDSATTSDATTWPIRVYD
ncbi:MAG: hypothetical protein JKY93_02115 [Gammaproteobacteria bacterium]|nr:hypothetical protein [Gammaproteobacteria bacterium]